MRSISRRRRPRTRGYALADALAAAAVSAIAAAFALQLLAKCAADIRRAQEALDSARLAERLYEEARLEGVGSLASTREGKVGAFHWRRSGTLLRKPVGNSTDEVIPVRLMIEVSSRGRLVQDLEGMVAPGGPVRPDTPFPKS